MKAMTDYLKGVEGLVVLILAVGYLGLVFFNCYRWSDKSGELIIGFALFSQGIVGRFFDYQHRKDEARKREAELEAARQAQSV